MKMTLNGVTAFEQNGLVKKDVTFSIGAALSPDYVVDGSPFHIFPGFVDVHVHFREPGFSYKETVKTGSAAAARGGFTAVCTMPNLNPVPDSLAHLAPQLDAIRRDAAINVIPFAAITCGEEGKRLSDMEALAPFVCGFSDDGRGVDDVALMREAMQRAAALGKVISAHCEDGTAPKDSPEAEWQEIERDIRLADEAGCAYHVCHISTKESVSLIRDAKKSGVNITCETAPHYLLLSDKDVLDDGRFRMNPPLRTEVDRTALLEGVCDGTIDMIATDHAPHSAEEKGRGFAKSLNGIVGLETSFPMLYHGLVKQGVIPLDHLIRLMSTNPAARFSIDPCGFNVFDLNDTYTVDPAGFATMGRSTPFAGSPTTGRCLATVYNGNAAYVAQTLLK